MTAKLFIGIPCYQASDILSQTLGFLARNTRTSHILDVNVARQSVVRNRNELLAKAKLSNAEYVCLCDDDIEPAPGWDQTLIAGIQDVHARTSRRIGQTGPLFFFPDGRIFCSWVNVALDPSRSHASFDPVGMGESPRSIHRALLRAGALTGTLSIFTRDFLESVHWRFDERYERSQYEDIDQSLTCRSHGFDLLYNGNASVIHHTKQAAPRASDENLGKLVCKWITRPELSLATLAEEPAVRHATAELFEQIPGIWLRIYRATRMLGGNPRRLVTAFQILRAHGVGAVVARCRDATC